MWRLFWAPDHIFVACARSTPPAGTGPQPRLRDPASPIRDPPVPTPRELVAAVMGTAWSQHPEEPPRHPPLQAVGP